MKISVTILVFTATLLAAPLAQAAEKEKREEVALPAMMKDHMLGNMRDHLLTLHEIHVALAKGELDKAGDIAEARLGMSSLVLHNASHLASYMPKAMQAIGTEMHHAASRFAMIAKEGDLPKALDGLSKVTAQCVTCHSAYRIK